MEDTEFAACYRRLIAYYGLSPEKANRQYIRILRRIRAPSCEIPGSAGRKRYQPTGGNICENQTAEPEE